MTPRAADETALSLRRKLALAREILIGYLRVRRLWHGDLSTAVTTLRSDVSKAEPAREETAARIEGLRLGRAVRRTLGVLPMDSTCLMQSLVLTSLLARRGIDSTLVIAVRTEPSFAAHAWIEYREQPLLPPGLECDRRLVEL